MIDIDAINIVFKTLLEAHTDATFAMQEDNNRPRPPLPYITFDTNSLVSIGHDALLDPDVDGNAEILGDREFVVPIRYYGKKSIVNLEQFYAKMYSQQVTIDLAAVGVVFVQMVGAINNLTMLIDTKYEQRAGVDFLFRIASVITDAVGVIEDVNAESTYKIDGEIIKEVDIEISTP